MTKPPGSLLVRVVNINGKEIYRTWACTVQEVKDDLRVQYGYKLEAQKLMYKAQILRPHTDLAPYGDSVELTLVLQTVLCEAASDGREEVVRKLLSRGAGLDPAGDPCPMIQAMQGAAFYGHEGVARLLLEVARPEDRNLMVTSQSWMEFPGEFADGTPLHTAAHKGHVAMIELLLSVGVPKAEFLQAINRSGQLALHGAAMEKGDERAFCLLLQPVGTRERKRMLSVRDRRERTPLHYAAINGHEAIFRRLPEVLPIDQVHSVLAIMDEHETVFHTLARWNTDGLVRDVMRFMNAKQQRAMLMAQDKRGRTPLHAARSRGGDRSHRRMLQALDPAVTEADVDAMLAISNPDRGRSSASVDHGRRPFHPEDGRHLRATSPRVQEVSERRKKKSTCPIPLCM